MGLCDAAPASFDLIDALGGNDDLLVEWRRSGAWAVLRAFATDLRAAHPSLWARERGLGW